MLRSDDPKHVGFVEQIDFPEIKFLIQYLQNLWPKFLVGFLDTFVIFDHIDLILKNTQALQGPNQRSLVQLAGPRAFLKVADLLKDEPLYRFVNFENLIIFLLGMI